MNEHSYRLSFKYRFEAAHRLTKSCADSCATPHGHTWYAKAIFEARESTLGGDDMVMEFASLKSAWKTFVTQTADHSFMHHFNDPILPVLREAIPMFRGLPFPGDPTTELVAALFYNKLCVMHETLPEAENIRPIGVLIRETPTNSIYFKASSPQSLNAIAKGATNQGSALLGKINSGFEGWWQSPDPHARTLLKKS